MTHFAAGHRIHAAGGNGLAAPPAAMPFRPFARAPRILHVNKFWGRDLGGVEAVLHAIVNGLDRRGYEQTVLVCRRAGVAPRAAPDRVRLRMLIAPVLASMPIHPAYAALFERVAMTADLIHFHLPFPLVAWAAPRRAKRCPWVASLHADETGHPNWLQRPHAALNSRFLQRCDSVLVSSPALAVSPLLRNCAAHVEIVPFGVDTRRFAPIARSEPPSLDPVTILFVGRLVRYKGLDRLIRALHGLPGRLVVAGEGPERRPLQRLARRLGMLDRIAFLGHVEDERLPEIMRAADIFVLPSLNRAEAFGLAQLEAMASGLPVINTELGTGTTFVSIAGVSGLTVSPGDEAALAAALRQLIESPELRRRLGQAARHRAVSLFAHERYLEAIDSLYRRLLQGQLAASA